MSSDLISTPSQTQSTVSNEAFEALIDLLTSDGVDENPGGRARTQPNMTLRDSSGKLDFDKIRLMFAAQDGGRRVSNVPESLGQDKNRVQSPTVPNKDADSDGEPHSHRSLPSTRPNSMSPKPVERQTTGHRRSSTFGNQQWAAIHENATAEGVAPTQSHQPLSFDELNTALADAHEEVRSLRQQYDELQALVSKRLGAKIGRQAKIFPIAVKAENVVPDKDCGRVETRDSGFQGHTRDIVPLVPSLSDVPTEIANLSGDEAKRALSAVVRSLNLSLDLVANPLTPAVSTSPQQCLFPPNPTRQHDVASITRAVKFLGTVDELVWRRASGPSGPRTLLPVFSEENIVALLARLELWERAVRRSSRV